MGDLDSQFYTFVADMDSVRYTVDGAQLYRARVAAGLTIDELARRCSMSNALLSYIENEKLKRGVARKHMIALCCALPELTVKDVEYEEQ